MKDIPGFEGRYAVTADGRVWSHARQNPNGGRPALGQWLKPRISRAGYLTVFLRKEGKGNNYSIHRLVLSTFMGNPPSVSPCSEANHLNGVKTDNRLENLEWTTASGNRHHAWTLGLISQTAARKEAGFRRGRKLRKLSGVQATTIRNRHSGGETVTELAKEYRIDRRAVYNILQRKTYAREE